MQIIDAGTVDWFPHVSPDGRALLCISYDPGTPGHPEDRDVVLRVLPLGDDGLPAEGAVRATCCGRSAARARSTCRLGPRLAALRLRRLPAGLTSGLDLAHLAVLEVQAALGAMGDRGVVRDDDEGQPAVPPDGPRAGP